jgi:hypothetical protein
VLRNAELLLQRFSEVFHIEAPGIGRGDLGLSRAA